MNKLLFILWALLPAYTVHCQVTADQLYRPDANDQFDQIVARQSANLDSLIYPSDIWLSDIATTQFDPGFGVIINKPSIIDLATRNHFADYENLLRLVIAHEKMHGFQNWQLRNINLDIRTLSNEDKHRLECQADMCAGFTFLFPKIRDISIVLAKAGMYQIRQAKQNAGISTVPVPDFADEDSTIVFSMLQQYNDGIQLFFQLGETNGLFSTHPIPEYRKKSFELGENAFIVAVMNYPLPQDIRFMIQADEMQSMQANLLKIEMDLGILPQDFQQNGFFVSWSERIVRKIEHVYHNASKQVVFEVFRQHFDTSALHPFYYFTLKATNYNPDTVLIDFDVPMYLVSRTAPWDPLQNRTVSAFHKLIQLAPGGSEIISDSTMWTPGDSERMPSVRLPGDEGSMYYVSPKNPRDVSYYISGTSDAGRNPALTDQDNSPAFNLMISQLQQTLRMSDINSLKDGAGILQHGKAYIKYNYYNFGRHFTLNVSPDDPSDEPFLTYELGRAATMEEANETVRLFANQLLQIGGQYSLNDHLDSYGLRHADILDNSQKVLFSVDADEDYIGFFATIDINK